MFTDSESGFETAIRWTGDGKHERDNMSALRWAPRAATAWPRGYRPRTVAKSDTLVEDAMIAATATVHFLTVSTRNVRDFSGFEVKLVNPFGPTPPEAS